MKKFTALLLSVIFVTLIAGSVQSIAADHLEPGQGIFFLEYAVPKPKIMALLAIRKTAR